MDIINDILIGVHKADGEYVTIPDRKEAIKYCMEHAGAGDIIILAGKGHEDYQEIKGVKHHMDERDLIQEIIWTDRFTGFTFRITSDAELRVSGMRSRWSLSCL